MRMWHSFKPAWSKSTFTLSRSWAVEQALADGTLTQAALDASVLRVLQLKLAHGIVPLPETG